MEKGAEECGNRRQMKQNKLGEMGKCCLHDDKVEALWLYPLYSGFSNMGVIDKNRYDRAMSPPLGESVRKVYAKDRAQRHSNTQGP